MSLVADALAEAAVIADSVAFLNRARFTARCGAVDTRISAMFEASGVRRRLAVDVHLGFAHRVPDGLDPLRRFLVHDDFFDGASRLLHGGLLAAFGDLDLALLQGVGTDRALAGDRAPLNRDMLVAQRDLLLDGAFDDMDADAPTLLDRSLSDLDLFLGDRDDLLTLSRGRG